MITTNNQKLMIKIKLKINPDDYIKNYNMSLRKQIKNKKML